MEKFSKKSMVLLALIALVLFVGMIALIMAFMPELDWNAQPEYSPEPAAVFVYQIGVDKSS